MGPQAPEPSDWLVQTKLQPPMPRSDVITRPRLLAALRDGLTSRRLTLLSAPAGYGKTTLLAQAIADFRLPIPDSGLRPAHDLTIENRKSKIENPAAWLTLDEGDNDPLLFLAYLVAALQSLSPACGTTAKSQIENRKSKIETQRIVGVLINDVLETLPDPFVLILDDLHLVTEPAVHLALDYLLEHLPPQMRLAIATRRDPPLALARLRARGELAELRLPVLRFTLDEATAFLNETLRLGLTAGDLAALQARTEGWPVGLRLLAGSLDRIPTPADRAAFIAHLAHTDRHVFDFLADEVLSRQSPAVRAFLLQTSILPELTPALCNAVTGRTDAELILEDLDRRSLFVTSVPTPTPPHLHTPYRYHALFAEFLRQQLEREMGERVTDLHRRAAEAQTTPVPAISHYLAAEMWEEAVQAIAQVSVPLFQRGMMDTLAGWVRALPPPVREAYPGLLSELFNRALFKGELEEAQSLLERLLQVCEEAGDEEAQGPVLAGLALTAFLQADFERAERLIPRALAYPLPPPHLVQSQMVRAWLGLLRGDWAQAEADFETALAVTEGSGEPLVWLMLALLLKPPFAVLPDGLERIECFCRQATTLVEDAISLLPLAVGELMAFVHLWRGRLEQAIQAGERALALREQVGSPSFLGADGTMFAAVAHAARGETAAADRLIEVMRPQVEEVPLLRKALKVASLYLQGRALWSQACTEPPSTSRCGEPVEPSGRRFDGAQACTERVLEGPGRSDRPSRSNRLEEARQVYAQMCAARSPGELPFAPVLRLTMCGLLEMAGPSTGSGRGRRYAEAERLLQEAASLERKARLSTLYSSARLMLAHLYLEWNRPQDALAELVPLLAECEREGTPGLILKEGAAVVPVLRLAVERSVHAPFAAYLLDTLGMSATEESRPVPVPGTGETLTRREVQVLRLLATRATNREIARQLVISPETVKTHVAHILRKLDVSSRAQAVARARELRIL